MDSDRINRRITMVANVGVLVGLIVLILEVNQNTEMMRAQMLDSQVQGEAARRNASYANDIHQILAKLEDEGQYPITKQAVQHLSTVERRKLRSWYASRLISYGNSFYQCQEGFLDDETCNGRNLYPGFIEELNAVGYDMRNMRASFIAEVRRIAQENNLPVIGEDGRWE